MEDETEKIETERSQNEKDYSHFGTKKKSSRMEGRGRLVRARATGRELLDRVCDDLARLCSVASAFETPESGRLPRITQREASLTDSDRAKNAETPLELPSIEPFPGAASLSHVSAGHVIE